jgi:hypothetical protein
MSDWTYETLAKKTKKAIVELGAELGVPLKLYWKKDVLIRTLLAGLEERRHRDRSARKERPAPVPPSMAGPRPPAVSGAARRGRVREGAGAEGEEHRPAAPPPEPSREPATPSEARPVVLEESPELPPGYGRDRVGIMPINPGRVFAYWEITGSGREDARNRARGETRLVLRLFAETSRPREREEASESFDIEVPDNGWNWYVDVPHPGWVYRAEIGLRTPDGRFFSIARSTRVRTPSTGPSPDLTETWVLFDARTGQLQPLPAAAVPGARGPRPAELQESPSGLGSSPSSPFSWSSPGAFLTPGERQGRGS